jgi:hypothetical protein
MLGIATEEQRGASHRLGLSLTDQLGLHHYELLDVKRHLHYNQRASPQLSNQTPLLS